MLGNGPQVLLGNGNGPLVLGNGPHVLGIMSHSEFCRIRDYVAFGLCHLALCCSALCRIQTYVVRHNVAYNIMTHSDLCHSGLCCLA